VMIRYANSMRQQRGCRDTLRFSALPYRLLPAPLTAATPLADSVDLFQRLWDQGGCPDHMVSRFAWSAFKYS
jgi:hypothetical protein